MPLDGLLESLRSDAAQERARVLAEADAAATHVREASMSARRRRRDDALSRVRREELEHARRVVSTARQDAAAVVIRARATLLERVRRAVELLVDEAYRDSTYLDRLPDELASALARLPSGPVVVEASESVAPPLRDAAARLGGIRVVTEPGRPAGFAVRGENGSIEVDATLRAMLDVQWPRIAIRVSSEVDG